MKTATQPTLDTVSAYWESRGKTIADKRTGRTFLRSDGVLACDECCLKDGECDTPGHFHRDSCLFCLGTGVNAAPQETPAQQEPPTSASLGFEGWRHGRTERMLFFHYADRSVAVAIVPYGTDLDKQRAEFIVKSVNRSPAFQKLMAVVSRFIEIHETMSDANAHEWEEEKLVDKAREALRLAREGEG